jgi:Domain of unknown function (DUF4390)
MVYVAVGGDMGWILKCLSKRMAKLNCFSVLLLMIGMMACYVPQVAWSQTINVSGQPALAIEDDGLMMTVQFKINLTTMLEDALLKGIPLYFNRDFELSRSRWYWLDEDVLKASQVWRLDYHALTQQYRLSSGLFHQNVNTLEDAIRLLQHAQSWKVAERHAVPKGAYEARVRLSFDPSRLPTPLQLGALSQKEWTLTSEWMQWHVNF